MRNYTKLGLIVLLSAFCLSTYAQPNTNKYRVFFGVGDNNAISDYVALTDKTFLGEVSGQARAGIRLGDNYEINVALYQRKYPQIADFPGLTYNKKLGYSAAFMYEFRKPDSRWGIPFGIEYVKFNRNLDSSFNDGSGTVYFDHYSASGFGPKTGLRCHFTRFFFLEAEIEILYEKFKWEVDWIDKSLVEANKFSSFKFIGLSANICF